MQEYQDYEDSLKYYRDLKNSLDTAKEEGKIEGLKKGIRKGKIQVALKMLKKGLEISLIKEITGLSDKEINELKDFN